jgi:hypothetical protein
MGFDGKAKPGRYLKPFLLIQPKDRCISRNPKCSRVEMVKQGLFRKGETMKAAGIAAMLLSLVFLAPGFAAESNKPPKVPTNAIEQRKAKILQNLDQRITKLQQEKDCVKAAKSDDDLIGCRDKKGTPHGKKGGTRQAGKALPSDTGGLGGPPGSGGSIEPDDEAAE